MKKFATAVFLTVLVTPAFAADYYVVQDATTKKCTIVDQKPTVTTTTVVGDGTAYKTREEATTGMKTIKVCSSN